MTWSTATISVPFRVGLSSFFLCLPRWGEASQFPTTFSLSEPDRRPSGLENRAGELLDREVVG